MQSGPITQTTPLTVTLQVQEWNAVISAMAEAPFKLVAPLVNAITQQLQEQAPPQQPNGNGQDMGRPLSPPN